MQLILLAPYCQTAEHSLVRGQQWNNTATKNVESKNVEKPKQNLGDMWNICDYTCLIVYFSIYWLAVYCNQFGYTLQTTIIAKLAGINIIIIIIYVYSDNYLSQNWIIKRLWFT